MTDERRRNRERAAKADPGDEAAQAALEAITIRTGGGRHGDKLGTWIVIETVQCHWLGNLRAVTEFGGGVGIAHLHPCYWLSNTENLTAEAPRKVPSSEAVPADVYLTAAVLVASVDPAWDLKSLPK